jgi:hypothetical protein
VELHWCHSRPNSMARPARSRGDAAIILDFLQLVQTVAANGWVLFLQETFVCDRLRLHIFNGSQPPLAVEAIDQGGLRSSGIPGIEAYHPLD